MRLLLLILLFCGCAVGQPPLISIAGIWDFTFRSSSATVQIKQAGSQLSGEFLFAESTIPLPFTGTLSTLFNVSAELTVVNTNGSKTSYSGTVARDGNSMSGTSTNGNWVSRRLPGFGAPRILGVTNAASGKAGSVAPGQIISLFANAPTNPIGTETGVGTQVDASGKVATEAGRVRVRFLPTGVYAPLTYVGAGQINAVVPYEIAGLSATQVQIEYLGRTSNTFPLSVAPTVPPQVCLRSTEEVSVKERF